MSRSVFKGPYCASIRNLKKKRFEIMNKNITIMPEFLHKVIYVYNGKKFIKLTIREGMLGYKFGEFVRTKSIYKYKKK